SESITQHSFKSRITLDHMGICAYKSHTDRSTFKECLKARLAVPQRCLSLRPVANGTQHIGQRLDQLALLSQKRPLCLGRSFSGITDCDAPSCAIGRCEIGSKQAEGVAETRCR